MELLTYQYNILMFFQAFCVDFSNFYNLNFNVKSDVRTECFLYHGILQE